LHVEPWIWIAFLSFIAGMLAIDLLVFQREAHAVSMREAGIWSAVWIALGLTFGAIVWLWQGPEAGGEYLAGYLIEKSLSVDNIFVFALIFGYFAVPAEYQHRVLFWGVFGALVFRAIFIAAGATLLDQFHWMIYVFGAFLVITGIRMARSSDEHVDPGKNPVLRLFRRFVPMTDGLRHERFFVKESGRRLATPLLAVLVVMETTDIIFAIDSIPAIFAITTDTFIVFTSNAFADDRALRLPEDRPGVRPGVRGGQDADQQLVPHADLALAHRHRHRDRDLGGRLAPTARHGDPRVARGQGA
jgi:tellurite resistance protein TerC